MNKTFLTISFSLLCLSQLNAQEPVFSQKVSGSSTTVSINNLDCKSEIDPMIYGQMLEDCNDKVIYGGVVNNKGTVNKAVVDKLKTLQIPVMRWPAGTSIYDYEWRRGVGPTRTAQKESIWGGYEYYTFGTDEYISWCREIGTEPYINIPMGNNNTYTHSVGEALDWVEYVNGDANSPMGAYRVRNGHKDPYKVKYWCIGNENYLANKYHSAENAETYANRLVDYASTIKKFFPEVELLGVGHNGNWNNIVTNKCGEYLDFLTLHFYMNAKIKDSQLIDPHVTLFSPERVEANIRHFAKDLKEYNRQTVRSTNPIRFSIDEWNCRHSVYNGNDYSFTRKDGRRLYDVASMASMLNVFIRTSPYVGMANYIFPVNGHGLLKTVGEQDAYASACYDVFRLYRQFMNGNAVGVDVSGPGIKNVALKTLSVSGDTDSSQDEATKDLCYIDCAATLSEDNQLAISLINRSYDTKQKVKISVPVGYEVSEAWTISHSKVSAENTEINPENIMATNISVKSNTLTLNPCAIAIILFKQTSKETISVNQITEPLILNKDADYHITSRVPFTEFGTVDFQNIEHAALVFENIKPSELINNYMNQITICQEKAVLGENCLIKLYNKGSIVLPYNKELHPLICYSKPDFQGVSCDRYTEGSNDGYMQSLTDDNLNNDIYSFRLKRGYMVTFSLGLSGWGYSRCFIADKKDLEINLPQNMAGRISSYRIFKWQDCRKAGLAECDDIPPTNLLCNWCLGDVYKDGTLPDIDWIAPYQIKEESTSYTNDILGATCHILPAKKAELSTSYILSYWQELMRTGYRLCSFPGNIDSDQDLESFIDSIDSHGWRCDVINLKGDGNNDNLSELNQIHLQYGSRPLWLSPFIIPKDKTQTELESILNVLNDIPYLERYTIDSSRESLYTDDNLTQLGKYYNNMDDGIAYNVNYESIPNITYLPITDIHENYNQITGKYSLTWNDPNGDMLDSVVVECCPPDKSEFLHLSKLPLHDLNNSCGAHYSFLDSPHAGTSYYRIASYPVGSHTPIYSPSHTVDATVAHGTNQFQYGTIQINNTESSTIDFSQKLSASPAIFMGVYSDNNSHLYPGNLITQASRSLFNYQILPWTKQLDSQIDIKQSENLPFWVLQDGADYLFDSLKCEVGSTKVIGDTTQILFRTSFPDGVTPIVLTEFRSPSLRSNTLNVRIWNVTNKGFSAIVLYEKGVENTITIGQTLCYCAITPGKGSIYNNTIDEEILSSEIISVDTFQLSEDCDSICVHKKCTYKATVESLDIFAGQGSNCYGTGYHTQTFSDENGNILTFKNPYIFGQFQTFEYHTPVIARRGKDIINENGEITGLRIRRQVDNSGNTTESNTENHGDRFGWIVLHNNIYDKFTTNKECYSYLTDHHTGLSIIHKDYIPKSSSNIRKQVENHKIVIKDHTTNKKYNLEGKSI